MKRLSAAVISAAVVLTLTSACADSAQKVPMPAGVKMLSDQSRLHRKDREIYVRIQNQTDKTLRVESFTLTSDRIGHVNWSGNETIAAGTEADLEYDMPQGRCGDGFTPTVRLTYRLDDGGLRESSARADDRYGTVSLALDRDCAQNTLTEAARIAVGKPVVTGAGSDSVLDLPVTLTPTGKRDDVSFGGFGSTILFNQTDESPIDVDVPLGKDDPPAELHMLVRPARCDGHALADDKVGRLFDVSVRGDDVGEGASFYLPLTNAQRVAFFDFYRSNCGLG